MALTNALPPARVAKYSPFFMADGSQIDTGLSLLFLAPHSFTGEDVLELHAHGGPVVLDLLMRRVTELGARIARAGEFSERAFLNNKMDLVQVEAVAELINASSEQAALAASRSLQGGFSVKINTLVEEVTRLRMFVEAAIDFPDEEIDFLTESNVVADLQSLLQRLQTIYAQAKQGALLCDGINAVIVGQPNVGKSTLLNTLTGEDTAIVTPIAGTTRDTIKAQINLDGVRLNIVDTAGMRETDDYVEQQGIERTRKAIGLADLVLLVVECADKIQHDPFVLHPELSQLKKPTAAIIVVANKIDQQAAAPFVQKFTDYALVAISAHKNQGLDLLRELIKDVAGVKQDPEAGLFLARRRHLQALDMAQQNIHVALQQLVQNRAGELMAEELKQAQFALGEITGKFTSDDLLGRIFAEFCIGK